jgi:23S rRNA pseudouridine2604 synthase
MMLKLHLTSALTYLIHAHNYSKKEAVGLISGKKLFINGLPAQIKQEIFPADEVYLEDRLLKPSQPFIYLVYHKPRGVECTLNTEIPDNLLEAIAFPERVYPIGRLDKDSDGLLLMTNDGSIYNKITHCDHHQEKEYHVTVDSPLTEEALWALANGITIMGKTTRPAQVKKLTDTSFTIVLTQGMNRQIRRMCYKLGYQVLRLTRTRMLHITLQDLPSNQYRHLNSSEINDLFAAIA